MHNNEDFLPRTDKPKQPWDMYIPFLSGRPDRDRAIGSDDILNLQIALNTAQSLDQLCYLT